MKSIDVLKTNWAMIARFFFVMLLAGLAGAGQAAAIGEVWPFYLVIVGPLLWIWLCDKDWRVDHDTKPWERDSA